MPQIVQANAFKTSAFGNGFPRALQIGAWSLRIVTWNDKHTKSIKIHSALLASRTSFARLLIPMRCAMRTKVEQSSA